MNAGLNRIRWLQDFPEPMLCYFLPSHFARSLVLFELLLSNLALIGK